MFFIWVGVRFNFLVFWVLLEGIVSWWWVFSYILVEGILRFFISIFNFLEEMVCIFCLVNSFKIVKYITVYVRRWVFYYL